MVKLVLTYTKVFSSNLTLQAEIFTNVNWYE